jgi:Glycosyltransferase family 9 (heptosyltransferase)
VTGTHFATTVLFHNGIGDYVMAQPTLRALCEAAPKPICLVAGDGPHSFLLKNAGADSLLLVPFEHRWPHKDFNADTVLSCIGTCDFLISLCPYDCPGQTNLIEALKSAHSIGFTDRFSERLDYSAPGHEIEVLFQSARRFNVKGQPAMFARPLPFSALTQSRADALRRAIGLESRLLVLHLDSRSDKSLKPKAIDKPLSIWLRAWPNLFALAFNMDVDALPLATRTDRVRAIRGAGLEQAMALAAEADIFVGVDSCMLHVADHALRAQLGLFGPTDPARTGAYWSPISHALRSATSCMDFDTAELLEAGLSVIAAAHQ